MAKKRREPDTFKDILHDIEARALLNRLLNRHFDEEFHWRYMIGVKLSKVDPALAKRLKSWRRRNA